MPDEDDMSADEFHRLLGQMNVGVMQFARMTGIEERAVRHMASGRAYVPPAIADWLREIAPKVAAIYAASPVPPPPELSADPDRR
ncbi:MAG: hypothetical protein JWP57_4381 [Spirosoma sp.]|nr:hypothetical protein [Spirosoma sp.]